LVIAESEPGIESPIASPEILFRALAGLSNIRASVNNTITLSSGKSRVGQESAATGAAIRRYGEEKGANPKVAPW
jgi:hypothetical protein